VVGREYVELKIQLLVHALQKIQLFAGNHQVIVQSRPKLQISIVQSAMQ
jgi:hypothetical protein